MVVGLRALWVKLKLACLLNVMTVPKIVSDKVLLTL